jgi:hypothetical protein
MKFQNKQIYIGGSWISAWVMVIPV